jgi:hypothetical protein
MLKQAFILASLMVASTVIAEAPLPSKAADKHLGVASCASSTCHGSVSAYRDSNVRQDEFATWQSADPHAGAYQLLMDDDSKRIAKNLGLENAHEADICLDCHADNVAADRRGEKFQMSDGIGCEACHGGSERWLSSHATGQASHEDNLAAGLYPTEDSVDRGRLCLSCHQGNPDQMITHRIMGAGHPRISFELDTFTWMNPHFDVDDDYLQRKGDLNDVRDWGVGQGVAAVTQLETLLDDHAGWDGIFPELVLFDCHACHRLMSGNKWVPRRGTGLGPGIVRFNDANLLMYRHVVASTNSELAETLATQTRDFHVATTKGRQETTAAAQALLSTLQQSLQTVNQFEFDSSALKRIFASLLQDGERGQYRDYAAAEQVAMAVDTLLVAFERGGSLSSGDAEALREKADGLFQATDNEDGYTQKQFVAALKVLEAAAP